jgi:hypothetical protein
VAQEPPLDRDDVVTIMETLFDIRGRIEVVISILRDEDDEEEEEADS